jgi:hypothetical protein
MEAPARIVCVDCGGRCHLLSYAPEEGWLPGDVVAYRCEDCGDRWDVVLAVDDDPDEWTRNTPVEGDRADTTEE